jgi:acyl carrier protein
VKNDIFEKLKNFVIKESYVEDEVITTETKIADDLGVNGDDAVEFLIAYGKEFDVDVSKFMAADYFSPEGSGFISLIKSFLRIEDDSTKKHLTVGHLLKGIEAGRLDEGVMNG